MKKRILLPHSGSGSKRSGFSSFPSPVVNNDSHIMRTVNPFNMNQTSSSAADFRAMKLICLMSSTVILLGTFVYNSVAAASYQMAIYSDAGLILGNTAVGVFTGSKHEESQSGLLVPVPIVKGSQYWLGLYLVGAVTIPYQIGFANLGAVFPGQMHSVRDTGPAALPVDISAIPATSQKISMWAVCKT